MPEYKATVKRRKWLIWRMVGTAYGATPESVIAAATIIGKTAVGRNPLLDIQIERVTPWARVEG